MLDPIAAPAPGAIKSAIRGVARIVVVPLVICYRLQSVIMGRRRAFPGYSQLLSVAPGLVGEYLRREFYRMTLTYCAPSACISFGTILATADISIGDRVYIGAYCVIGRCRIERNVLIASRVSILSGLHQHGISDLRTPIRDQPGRVEYVHVAEDCLIGEGAIVAADIGAHAVVSTGSVVFQPVPAYAVVRGNPASVIRTRQ